MNNSEYYHKKLRGLDLRFQYVLLLIVISITANGFSFITDEFIFAFFVALTILFFYNKKKLSPIILYLLAFWILINFLSYLHNRTTFDSYMFIGSVVKLIYPFLLIKLIGPGVFKKLERIIYILTLISLPLYLLQLLLPTIFISLSAYLDLVTRQEVRELGAWHIGFFNFLPIAIDRNSGFMWEPGAFAFMISLAFVIHFNTKGFILNNKFFVYTIALISTLSTMGYISLTIILIIYVIHSKSWIISILFIPLTIFYFQYVIDLDFMIPKINRYVLGIDKEILTGEEDYFKVNRFAYFFTLLNKHFTGLLVMVYSTVQKTSLEIH